MFHGRATLSNDDSKTFLQIMVVFSQINNVLLEIDLVRNIILLVLINDILKFTTHFAVFTNGSNLYHLLNHRYGGFSQHAKSSAGIRVLTSMLHSMIIGYAKVSHDYLAYFAILQCL